MRDRVNGPKWALAVVMMILGLLISTQFRIQRQVPTDPSRLRTDELVAALQEREEALQAANAEREKLRAEVEKLRLSISATVPPPQEDTDRLEILAGTRAVTGPGVIVTLMETPTAIAAKNQVRDEDIWRVLNELLTAGAEAVSVNGQRITSVTGIRNVGSRILVNQTMIASPVEIHAVGDPVVLEASMKLRGGVVELLGRWGIQVKVSKSDALKLPPLRSVPVFRFAKPQTEVQ
ncbi:MAG: DUF881 domain-containing protein [Bacillota bacterium]